MSFELITDTIMHIILKSNNFLMYELLKQWNFNATWVCIIMFILETPWVIRTILFLKKNLLHASHLTSCNLIVNARNLDIDQLFTPPVAAEL